MNALAVSTADWPLNVLMNSFTAEQGLCVSTANSLCKQKPVLGLQNPQKQIEKCWSILCSPAGSHSIDSIVFKSAHGDSLWTISPPQSMRIKIRRCTAGQFKSTHSIVLFVNLYQLVLCVHPFQTFTYNTFLQTQPPATLMMYSHQPLL